MRSLHSTRLIVFLSFAALFCDADTRAAEPMVEVITQNGVYTNDLNSSETGLSFASPSAALVFSFGGHFGYDDNFTTAHNASGSWFADQQILLSYNRTHGDTALSLLAGGVVVERFGHETDGNVFFDLSVNHRATERLSFDANFNAAYRSEPDFSTNVGPNRRAGNYFTTTDTLAAHYEWSQRFSTVTGYAITVIRYENSLTAAATDREEHTLSQEFRFNLLRGTTLVGDYRFTAVDYGSAPLDSMTHFLLAGVEHKFSARLQAQARAGVSFRSFDHGGSETDPTFEGVVNYLPGRHSTLSWTARYAVEEPTTIGASGQKTFRTGLQFQYSFTSRLSSSLGFYYEHDDQSGPVFAMNTGSSSSEAYDLIFGVRYQISHHLDVDAGFEHTETAGGNGFQNYSRNRYSVGVNISF